MEFLLIIALIVLWAEYRQCQKLKQLQRKIDRLSEHYGYIANRLRDRKPNPVVFDRRHNAQHAEQHYAIREHDRKIEQSS